MRKLLEHAASLHEGNLTFATHLAVRKPGKTVEGMDSFPRIMPAIFEKYAADPHAAITVPVEPHADEKGELAKLVELARQASFGVETAGKRHVITPAKAGRRNFYRLAFELWAGKAQKIGKSLE